MCSFPTYLIPKLPTTKVNHMGHVTWQKTKGVGGFVVAMLDETFLEELVSNNTCLREAVHAMVDLHIDISILYLGEQIIVVDYFLGNEFNGHMHILVPAEGRFQAHVGDVGSGVACTLAADGGIP